MYSPFALELYAGKALNISLLIFCKCYCFNSPTIFKTSLSYIVYIHKTRKIRRIRRILFYVIFLFFLKNEHCSCRDYNDCQSDCKYP